MKFLRSFSVLTLLILSSNLFATEITQNILSNAATKSTNGHTQWLFENDGLNFLTNSPADYVQQQLDYERVYFQNNCNSTVSMVSRYKDLDNRWVTDGPWKLTPGEKGYLFDTRNSIIYFYGVSDQGHRWQGDHIVVISGYEVPMQEVRMNITNWGTFTLGLNCR